MLSATASLGLLHLWDVDGGLTPIDKYLYSNDEYIKSGALIALGMVNCRVRDECDPALALLGEFVSGNSETLQIGAIFGIGLAYAGKYVTYFPYFVPSLNIRVNFKALDCWEFNM